MRYYGTCTSTCVEFQPGNGEKGKNRCVEMEYYSEETVIFIKI